MRGVIIAVDRTFHATVLSILAGRPLLAVDRFATTNLCAIIIEHSSGFYWQDDAHLAIDTVSKHHLGSFLESSHDGSVGEHVGLGYPGGLPDNKKFVIT